MKNESPVSSTQLENWNSTKPLKVLWGVAASDVVPVGHCQGKGDLLRKDGPFPWAQAPHAAVLFNPTGLMFSHSSTQMTPFLAATEVTHKLCVPYPPLEVTVILNFGLIILSFFFSILLRMYVFLNHLPFIFSS